MSSSGATRIRRGQIEVVLAALAFALSVPAGKVLLADVPPLALSGVFYFAAGLLCLILVAAARGSGRREAETRPDRLHGAEWGWLAGAVLCGGVLGPLALLYGLRAIHGYVAGLLLNFESVFTVGIAVAVAGERLGRRGWLGAAAILTGALLLSLPGGAAAGVSPAGSGAMVATTRWPGVLLVVTACALWGIDNNLTQRISLRDARQIVAIKGLAAGGVSLALAAILGQTGSWNATRLVVAAMIGAVSFGLSIALFVRGLRQLGVIQTGMLFALGPGFAALFSWIFLGEPVALTGVAALAVMTAGALVLASDQHGHFHAHAVLEHAHPHEHDEHHQHDHTPEQLAAVPHTHRHAHAPVMHAHPHVHDVHHRHGH